MCRWRCREEKMAPSRDGATRPQRETLRKIVTSPLVGGGGGRFGFSVFRFGRFGPAAEVECDGHACVAQFIRESAIDEGTGDDHATDAQGSDALRSVAA